MKKIFLSIIAMLFIFSIENTFAKNGLIEDELNLNYGPIIYDLSLDDINVYNFKNKSLKKSYQAMVNYDDLVRDAIVSEYQKGSYSTETVNGIVKNYKSFVYYTNQMFYFMSLTDKNPKLAKEVDIQDAILKNYKNANRFYKSTKALVNKKESN